MEIVAIKTRIMQVPLRAPFITALRRVDCLTSLLVGITTSDGLTGYGEAAATAAITGETLESIEAAIRGYIFPRIQGRSLDDTDSLLRLVKTAVHGNTSAKAAVEMCLFDLLARRNNQPLWKMLGGYSSRLETDLTISLNQPEQMAADSLAAVESGYRLLKLKVGGGDGLDAERVEAVYSMLKQRKDASAVLLRIDANQAWTTKEAVGIIRRLEDTVENIDLVEQPVPAHDREGLTYVTQNTLTPILADESVFSLTDAVDIIQNRRADILNLKLAKTGGISQALAICALAENYGVKCMMGCMLEGRVALAAAASVAAASGVITRCDLDAAALCSENPYKGGPVFEGPVIEMNQEAGTGFFDIF